MSKTYKQEDQHRDNVEKYSTLIGICKDLGERYTPANQEISLSELKRLLLEYHGLMKSLKDYRLYLHEAIRKREQLIDSFQEVADCLCAVIYDDSSGGFATASLLRGIGSKTSGPSIIETIETDEDNILKELKQISVRQNTYDGRISQAKRLVSSLQKSDSAMDLEGDIKVFQSLLSALERSNGEIHAWQNDLFKLLDQRHKLLYSPLRGMVDRARAAIAYLQYELKP